MAIPEIWDKKLFSIIDFTSVPLQMDSDMIPTMPEVRMRFSLEEILLLSIILRGR